MCKSESIKELATALSKAQGSFDHAKKDVENGFFKSKYADLASVIDAAKKPLADNGLSVAQVVDMSEAGDLVLETILMHTSGEFIGGRYPIRPVKTDPQSVGSAITYARRYAFSSITGIAADDDDGNGASGKGATNTPTTQQKVENPVDATSLIKSATSLQHLASIWQTIPKDQQTRLASIKDEMKAKLTPKSESA